MPEVAIHNEFDIIIKAPLKYISANNVKKDEIGEL